MRARFADEIYRHGESRMGYTIFTVVFADGQRQAIRLKGGLLLSPYTRRYLAGQFFGCGRVRRDRGNPSAQKCHLCSRCILLPMFPGGTLKGMAEREGFEPPIPVKVYTLSRRAPSATRPSLHAHRFIFILSGSRFRILPPILSELTPDFPCDLRVCNPVTDADLWLRLSLSLHLGAVCPPSY